jgi:hypothetical protein
MKQVRTNRVMGFIWVLALLMLSAEVLAGEGKCGGERLCGEWQVKLDFGGRRMESILVFSKDEEGKPAGEWIGFWGVGELKDVKYEEGQLNFSRDRRNRQGQLTTSKFTGTIKDGKLTGTMSGERGEHKLEGERSKQMPGAVGSWEMKLKRGEREFTSTLVVSADEEGKLTAEWQSQRGEHEITDVEYEGDKLAFRRKSKMRGRERKSTFEGTVKGERLSGVLQSERGEITAEGKRVGASLIGKWNLEVASERGERKQRLKVNPDMSGMYGAVPIEKVNLEDDKVSFKTAVEFGERRFEMSFEGKVEGSKLTGELTTSRGRRKVTGAKGD